MEAIEQSTLFKFIEYSHLSLWDVKRYFNDFGLDQTNYIRLKDIFVLYRKEFNKKNIKEKGYGVMKKINFGGELYLRNEEEITQLKGNLFEVPENSIIYSKINLRHGCLYYHEKGKLPLGVSSEYPVFKFDDSKNHGEYLKMILRSEKIKNYFNSLTTGISKARIKVDEFLNIKIPLPSLEDQKRIVEAYHADIEQSRTIVQEAAILEESIDTYLMEELGIEIGTAAIKTGGLEFVEYKDLRVWNIEKIKEQSGISSKKYQFVTFADVTSRITDGTHQTPTYTDDTVGGVIFLSSKDVTSKEINWENIKYIPRSLHATISKNFRPQIGDIFLAKNGTTGVAAMLMEEREFAIYVSLAHIVPNRELIDPMFFLDYINSPFAKMQFDKNLIGVGVPNLHLSKIREAHIPLPPITIQREIVTHITAMKDEIRSLKKLSEELKQRAKIDFETEIFS